MMPAFNLLETIMLVRAKRRPLQPKRGFPAGQVRVGQVHAVARRAQRRLGDHIVSRALDDAIMGHKV